ncbi:hypothetical protein ACT691_16265 [Vibrio metschnikovii]
MTIVTVIVDTASKGLAVKTGLLPAANTTIMVSPIARLAASNYSSGNARQRCGQDDFTYRF